MDSACKQGEVGEIATTEGRYCVVVLFEFWLVFFMVWIL